MAPARRWLARAMAAIACAAAILAPFEAHAEQGSPGRAQLTLRSVVATLFRVSAIAQPSQLALTEADVARGYVDLADASSFELVSNARNSLSVAVGFDPALVARVAVRMLEGEVVADLPGASGAMRIARIGRRHVAVSYRVHLQPLARPGTYSWPIALSLSALS